LVALVCGLLGIAGGVVVAYVVQPRPTYGDLASPVPAVSPSVPIDQHTQRPYAKDIDFPTLSANLALPVVHTISNDLASWTYHVPQGWQAYAVCSTGDNCKPPMTVDTPLQPHQVNSQPEVRFRPSSEPSVGGFSLRVRILDNVLNDLHQMVATKIVGFRDSPEVDNFRTLKRTPSSVYFAYRDDPSNLHRYNFFQWFTVPGQSNVTLEMSVSGRQRDVAGLRALLNRFADNVTGSPPPQKEKRQQQ
jgi:hypothetical protein